MPPLVAMHERGKIMNVCLECGCYIYGDYCPNGCSIKIEQPTDLSKGLKSYRAVVRKIVITEYEVDTEAYNESELREMIQDEDWHLRRRIIKEIRDIKVGAVVETKAADNG